ncbi:MAG TPA: hypothetical protein VNO52_08660 [Methylomirabilota bacterium]|nr:hypothetical protein [Methylomirabilota bacterium]
MVMAIALVVLWLGISLTAIAIFTPAKLPPFEGKPVEPKKAAAGGVFAAVVGGLLLWGALGSDSSAPVHQQVHDSFAGMDNSAEAQQARKRAIDTLIEKKIFNRLDVTSRPSASVYVGPDWYALTDEEKSWASGIVLAHLHSEKVGNDWVYFRDATTGRSIGLVSVLGFVESEHQ